MTPSRSNKKALIGIRGWSYRTVKVADSAVPWSQAKILPLKFAQSIFNLFTLYFKVLLKITNKWNN